MKRIEFLKKKWADRVHHHARSMDHSMPSDVDVFDTLLKADPSPKLLYAEFVMRTYCAGEFLAEDIERIRETLSVFHVNKRRLPLEQRDIGSYSSERDLWAMLSAAGFLQGIQSSGKETKRSDRNRAHLESEVVRSEGWTMAKLGSAFSARWWGMGTRWCTTEKTGKTYHNYANKGPLRVFVSPDGIKHQLHIATGSLCDATDRHVDLTVYLGKLPWSSSLTSVLTFRLIARVVPTLSMHGLETSTLSVVWASSSDYPMTSLRVRRHRPFRGLDSAVWIPCPRSTHATVGPTSTRRVSFHHGL